MRDRCGNPNSAAWDRYGGRGIAVCARWQGENGFANFLADMGARPSAKHSIDRIDNDGPYSRENCRWATAKEQANNKRTNRWLTHSGETLTITGWSERLGMSRPTIWGRLEAGWSIDAALTTQINQAAKAA
jgi:hypothetical protein